MHEQLILSSLSFSFPLSLLSSPSLLLFRFSLLYTSPILPLLARQSLINNTQNRQLSVTILKTLPDKPHVTLHLVRLESEAYPEHVDVGACVMAVAEAGSRLLMVQECLLCSHSCC